MVMAEMASIEITQPTSLVEWRRIDPIIGFDRCDMASDPVVHHLGLCLHTARSRPSEMSPVCADHVASALQAYLKQAHNIVSLPPRAARGGLAPWQLRRAKEMLVSRLDEPISLPELARACKLSPGHFARAFRKMTGQPPHRWLMEQRIEKAKQLLVDSTLSLVQIALTCGFADQSHFTRVFAQLVQSSPGQWRRHWRSGPAAA
ncbi:MAG: helix-turn-helix transcriptional regulator [Alphaproteobacteria bacterium]|nr:MAG: helix-turn-helix transcriptional regulator [Alphaproteobacteria bacterium]